MNFLAAPSKIAADLQTITGEAKSYKILAEAPQVKYQEGFVASITEWEKAMTKTLSMVKTIAQGGEYNADALPRLIGKMDDLRAQHDEHTKHALQFGFAGKAKGSRAGSRAPRGSRPKSAAKAKGKSAA